MEMTHQHSLCPSLNLLSRHSEPTSLQLTLMQALWMDLFTCSRVYLWQTQLSEVALSRWCFWAILVFSFVGTSTKFLIYLVYVYSYNMQVQDETSHMWMYRSIAPWYRFFNIYTEASVTFIRTHLCAEPRPQLGSCLARVLSRVE